MLQLLKFREPQIWQWLKHRVKTQEGEVIEPNYYHQILVEEVEKIKKVAEKDQIPEGQYKKAAELFNTLVMKRQFSEFLTLGAYKELE